MKKKIMMIVLILILGIAFVSFLLLFNKEKEEIFTCHLFQEEVSMDKDVTYNIYPSKKCDDCITKIDIKTTYTVSNKNKDKLSTMIYILQAENKEYASNEGFSYKENRISSKYYTYTITIDPNLLKEEISSLYQVVSSLKEQEEILTNNGYTCK